MLPLLDALLDQEDQLRFGPSVKSVIYTHAQVMEAARINLIKLVLFLEEEVKVQNYMNDWRRRGEKLLSSPT